MGYLILTKLSNRLTPLKSFGLWFCVLVKVTLLLSSSSANSQSAPVAVESAQHSFNYIISTLNTFHSTGRLVNNPGIDGADLEAFIDVLDAYREEFSFGFNLDSAMCQFYLNPENGRMTLEEKTDIAFSFLANLKSRLERYVGVDRDFQQTLKNEFGSLILSQIQRQSVTAVSNQQLPASSFGEAAVIGFVDSACS